MTKSICFFIGTEAELIKLFPVIAETVKRKLPYRIIASGQNDITKSTVLARANGGHVDFELSSEKDIKKSAAGLATWWLSTYSGAAERIRRALPDVDFDGSVMAVHGDTVSTVMGAKLAKKLGMTSAHIEAGLRSGSLLDPFPEEIDRILTSRIADIGFAPGRVPCDNLKNSRMRVVDTHYNTVLDSLRFSRGLLCEDEEITALFGSKYFVFVLHRQENLMKKALVRELTAKAAELSKKMTCVFILHKTTEITLEQLGLLEELKKEPGVVMLTRREYFDFMKLLDGAQFVVTDGGSNQEELSYMGKPCIIMRERTEREEGLGENAMLYGGNAAQLDSFFEDYERFERQGVAAEESPSRMIVDELERCIGC